jgi:hypothetical protein
MLIDERLLRNVAEVVAVVMRCEVKSLAEGPAGKLVKRDPPAAILVHPLKFFGGIDDGGAPLFHGKHAGVKGEGKSHSAARQLE